jgi:pilus assembly protein CpaC
MKNNTMSKHGNTGRRAMRALALALAVACGTLPAAALAQAADARAAPAKPAARPGEPGIPVCKGELPQPTSLGVVAGKSTLVKLPGPITLRTLADAKVVQARLLAPDTLYILGVAVGSTNMITQDATGRCTLFDIAVGMDPDPLRAKLAQVMPEQTGIRVLAAADTLILTGVVSDAIQVEHAMNIATAYVRYSQDTDKNLQASATDNEGLGRMHTRVINMLSVASPQQVMLQVRVAEVSKPMVEKLGAELKWTGTSGDWTYGILSSFLSGGAGVIGGVKDGLSKFITIDAEKKDGLIKILAEPNVIAISGQEGSFLAGGKLYLPVAQSTTTGGSVVTLEQVEFGVGLKFTPTVLANGLINLKVAPEVSEPSKEGLTVQASNAVNRTVLPLITTRRATTTVQLYDGQTLVIGGLIKNSMVANIKAFPLLGEIPILGALFRSSDFAADRSEVLFVVTPRLVKPVAGPVPLPTDNYVEPSRADIFLRGRLEGTPPALAPAPAPQPQ